MTTEQEIEGKVTATNKNGFQIDGKRLWYNYSQYADEEEFEEPQKGNIVQFSVQRSKQGSFYVQTCRIIDNGRPFAATGRSRGSRNEQKTAPPSQQVEGLLSYLDHDITIARESAVKSAIEMLSHHPLWLESKAADKANAVLTMARHFEAFFLGLDIDKAKPMLESRLDEPDAVDAPF